LLSEKLVLRHKRCARKELPHHEPYESAEHRGRVSRSGSPSSRIGAAPESSQDEDCVTPSWRHSRREDNHEALPGSPPNTTGELPLCDDKLLTKKRVLRDQVYAAANEIRGHPGNEPKKVDHVSVLHRLRADGVCSQDAGRSGSLSMIIVRMIRFRPAICTR